jgi:hypothetical protein
VTDALFTHERTRWTGSRALALPLVTDNGTCRICEVRRTVAWQQPALLRHGGYGATEQHEIIWCDCGALTRSVHSVVSPRR